MRRLPSMSLPRGFVVVLALAAALFCVHAVFAAEPGAAAGGKPAGENPVRLTLGKAFACADYGGNKVCLVDPQGKIAWQYPARIRRTSGFSPTATCCSRTSRAPAR